MKSKNKNSNALAVSILSLSLLTVMAGAAVAPALGVISEYFADCDKLFVQMVISIPALFIVIANMFFSRLAEKFGAKTLVMAGLLLYTVGGCTAGLFDSIFLVLAMRALVGLGVGIIMPLSTGLLSYYFPPEKQEGLMGWSSAMNQMGGVVATLISGFLAKLSWRLSFLVYLMGLISIVLCLIFMPNEHIGSASEKGEKKKPERSGGKYFTYVAAMFLLMTAFFIYPANFAIVTAAEGVIPTKYIAVIMAGLDLVAFFGGLLFVSVRRLCGSYAKYLAPLLFTLGYVLLAFTEGWAGVLAGSACVGFANGCGVPYIISTASKAAGRSAVTSVMPLLSAAMYLAQFVSPFLLSLAASITASAAVKFPYYLAAAVSIIFVLWSSLIKERTSEKPESC